MTLADPTPDSGLTSTHTNHAEIRSDSPWPPHYISIRTFTRHINILQGSVATLLERDWKLQRLLLLQILYWKCIAESRAGV